MNKELTRAHVKTNEGFRQFAYDDATGTTLRAGDTLKGSAAVGYGRDLIHNGIAQPEAEILLADDIERIARAFDRDLAWWSTLPDDAQSVMVDIAYQTGIAGLAGFSKMLAALKANDFTTAAAELIDSDLGRSYPARATRNAALLKDATQGASHG